MRLRRWPAGSSGVGACPARLRRQPGFHPPGIAQVREQPEHDELDSWNPQSAGTYGWGGAASTDFWIDPYEELEVAFYTQLLPSGTYPLSQELSQLVYASIVA